MGSNWETEREEGAPEEVQVRGQFPGPKPEYKIKAHVVLEDSDTQTWGMVKDTDGKITLEPGEGILVGQWSRAPYDNRIHVFLETSIMALVDKATLNFAKYAEIRRQEASAPKSSRTRTPRAPKTQPVEDESMAKIAALRNRIGKGG